MRGARAMKARSFEGTSWPLTPPSPRGGGRGSTLATCGDKRVSVSRGLRQRAQRCTAGRTVDSARRKFNAAPLS